MKSANFKKSWKVKINKINTRCSNRTIFLIRVTFPQKQEIQAALNHLQQTGRDDEQCAPSESQTHFRGRWS